MCYNIIMKANKKQVGGKHYMKYKIQPIEFITQNKLNQNKLIYSHP